MNRVLLIPHIEVLNANALSSSITVGFPAMTAWLGCMHNLNRKLSQTPGFEAIVLSGMGVVSHSFLMKSYKDDGMYLTSLTGMGFPLKKNGERASFIEEARCDLEVSLFMRIHNANPLEKEALEDKVKELLLGGMKIAGGDILRLKPPKLLAVDDQTSFTQFKKYLMPGYLLLERRSLMREAMNEGMDGIEALLAFQKVYFNCSDAEPPVWEANRKTSGWIVPIATGYQGITDAFISRFQRDPSIEHRFAESIVTLGEFVMPYRIKNLEDMLWSYHFDQEHELYLCINEKLK